MCRSSVSCFVPTVLILNDHHCHLCHQPDWHMLGQCSVHLHSFPYGRRPLSSDFPLPVFTFLCHPLQASERTRLRLFFFILCCPVCRVGVFWRHAQITLLSPIRRTPFQRFLLSPYRVQLVILPANLTPIRTYDCDPKILIRLFILSNRLFLYRFVFLQTDLHTERSLVVFRSLID